MQIVMYITMYIYHNHRAIPTSYILHRDTLLIPRLTQTKYKCLSAQFCGHYQVPGSNSTSPSQQNVLIPRYLY